MKETNSKRKRISGLPWLSNGFDKGGKEGQRGTDLTDKSPSPESHSIRWICFVGRDRLRSGMHMRAHSAPMTQVPCLFEIRFKVEMSRKQL